MVQLIINNYKEFNSSTYHIIPKDNQTEYELLNYLSWKRKNNSYIERSSSVFPSNKVLKTSKLNLLNHLWSFAGYEEIPTFKDLFDEIS
jgi:hypothetical protein